MLFIFYKPNTVHQDLPVVQIKLHLLIPKTICSSFCAHPLM